MSMDSDSQQQEAALPRVVVRRSFSRYANEAAVWLTWVKRERNG